MRIDITGISQELYDMLIKENVIQNIRTEDDLLKAIDRKDFLQSLKTYVSVHGELSKEGISTICNNIDRFLEFDGLSYPAFVPDFANIMIKHSDILLELSDQIMQPYLIPAWIDVIDNSHINIIPKDIVNKYFKIVYDHIDIRGCYIGFLFGEHNIDILMNNIDIIQNDPDKLFGVILATHKAFPIQLLHGIKYKLPKYVYDSLSYDSEYACEFILNNLDDINLIRVLSQGNIEYTTAVIVIDKIMEKIIECDTNCINGKSVLADATFAIQSNKYICRDDKIKLLEYLRSLV